MTRRLGPAEVEAVRLTPYRLGDASVHDLLDRLFDTPAGDLAGRGYALRLRRDGERRIATLKSSGRVAGAVHSRDEIEVVVGADTATPKAWPEPIRGRVAEAIGGAPLRRIVTVRNRRVAWPVEREGRLVAEMALDEGVISAGGRRTRFREIEVELRGEGKRADLAAIGRRLASRLPLEPESRSKFARGLALRDLSRPA